MKKLFICLANSKKYTQRCIAGIELVKSSRRGVKFDIVRQNEQPVWLRPITSSSHGEVAAELVDHIKLLDVVEVNVTAPCPQGYQSENVLFDNQRPEVVDTINPLPASMDKLLAPDEPFLFGSKGKTVGADRVHELGRSLVFIKPAHLRVHSLIASKGNVQVRAGFLYGGSYYDLPVTDIGFIEKFSRDSTILQGCEHIYFTVSLGIAFEGWHYKLVAGIVYF